MFCTSGWSTHITASAVEGHVLDELDEGVLDPLEAAIMLEMLGIDVGDDRDRAVEAEEAAVALVGLDHHPVALARAARCEP